MRGKKFWLNCVHFTEDKINLHTHARNHNNRVERNFIGIRRTTCMKQEWERVREKERNKTGNRQQETVSFLWHFFFLNFLIKLHECKNEVRLSIVSHWIFHISIYKYTHHTICIFYSIPLRMLYHYYLDIPGHFYLWSIYFRLLFHLWCTP